ncbi:MAG: single-stranded DNA-binding protein [Propionibacterium sp.]|nr:single-stranded DNA-binding protein [Propionibacterium sp.]
MTGNNSITLRGRIGTDLRRFTTRNDQVIVRFRLAVSQFRLRDDGTFEERDTQWYTVRAWEKLARNALGSLGKGDPVIVVGRPTVNVWKDDQGEARGELVITAQTIGHDLAQGLSKFARTGALSTTQSRDAETDSAAGSTTAGADGAGSLSRLEGPSPDLPARQTRWTHGLDEGEGGSVGPDGVLPGEDDRSEEDNRSDVAIEEGSVLVDTGSVSGSHGPGHVAGGTEAEAEAGERPAYV